ncbi:MAG TPA: hypothetical protein PLU73_02745 [Bacteroidia bacterium]|nr:hypothetical protein [Bacteroidia bacterium]
MIKGITHQEIEVIVDSDLQNMFNPKANVSDPTKVEIKHEALKLSLAFIGIIDEFNLRIDSDDFVDRVLNRVDLFVLTYEKLLNAIPKKTVASSVGAIWYGFFTKAHSELDNISDKMLFEYGERKIGPILTARLRK